jgi:hypothetical protein
MTTRKATSCADSLDDPRLRAVNGVPRLIPREEFGIPFSCAGRHSGSTSGRHNSGSSVGGSHRALVIAGSHACFERTKRLALLPAGFSAASIHWSKAAISWPLNGSACADTQGQRMTDGTVRGHRAAWEAIAADDQPAFVFEEDAVLLGSAADWSDGLRQCAARQCDIAYMGMSGEFFTSHATYITPAGARRLLQMTRDRCNRKKADYAIRLACLGPAVDRCLRTRGSSPCDFQALTRSDAESSASGRGSDARSARPLRCLRPPRLLWMRGIESVGVWGYMQPCVAVIEHPALDLRSIPV